MTFGEKLYQLRTERKMSQEALARKLGVSRQAISRWELGEVVPDTANVLAVSKLFHVSVDSLLREERLADSNIPVMEDPEESLKDRQYQVGSGIGYRFLALAGPAVWHKHTGMEEGTLLLPFALGWTLLFGILLARTMHRVRKQNQRAANHMLRNDMISACIICFLPALLKGIPGNWEIFLAQLLIAPFLVNTWNALRRVYDLSLERRQKKR